MQECTLICATHGALGIARYDDDDDPEQVGMLAMFSAQHRAASPDCVLTIEREPVEDAEARRAAEQAVADRKHAAYVAKQIEERERQTAENLKRLAEQAAQQHADSDWAALVAALPPSPRSGSRRR